MSYLKSFPFTYLDLKFFKQQIDFTPLFDVNGKPIINWDGTGAIYDSNGIKLYSDTIGTRQADGTYDGVVLSTADAITQFGVSYPTYTSSSGLRNIDGLYNNLFNTTWGNTNLPFLQRTQVSFDNYVKPLAPNDPNAFYAKKFVTPPNPAAADYTKLGDNLSTAGVNEAHAAQNVVDYTPRMISQLVTTAGVTFETKTETVKINGVDTVTTHLVKDANGYTQIADAGQLAGGQQDGQRAVEINGDIGPGGFVANDTNGTDVLDNQEYFYGAVNPGVSPVNGWFALFGQFFDHGLDFIGKGADGTKITINLAPDDPMYGVIDPNTGQPATKIVISRANVSGFAADGTPQWDNHTSPYIDQSQSYGSVEQVTNLLREWVLKDPANAASGYRMGAELFDGHTSVAYKAADGTTTTATLPTLNELRAHLVATGRDDLSWEDISDLRNRDASGHVTTGTSGSALLLDSNPRFDADHLMKGDPAQDTAVSNAITFLGTKVRPGDSFGMVGGTLTLTLASDLVAGPSTIPAGTYTGASALMQWVNFSDFSIMAPPSGAIVNPAGNIHDAVSAILMASVGDHYIAGDGRANENIGLTAVHHVFHEEHNYQVDNIKESIIKLDIREEALDQHNTYNHQLLNEWQIDTGHKDLAGNFVYTNGVVAWNDEMLFNAAKMTVEMEYQHTAVDQFARTITPNLHEFVGYNSGENSTISVDFAQVAYRFGHSTLRESIDLMDPNGAITDHIMRVALERAFLSPEKFAAVGAGAIALGMTHQQANEIDEFLTPAMNQGLLGQPLDLAAINIARGRDLGVPTLNDMREALHLDRYASWADFGVNMMHPDNLVTFIAAYAFDGDLARAQCIMDLANDVVPAVNTWGYTAEDAVNFLNNTDTSLYGCDAFNKIDCWVGGLAEVHMTGGLLGETFDTIFVEQIGRLMDGDRFYYLQRLNNIPYGQQIIDEQFKDIIERNTGVEHLNGSAFSYADQYYEFDGQEVSNAKTEHKYGDALAANPALGVYSDGGNTTALNGDTVTVNGVQYIRDFRVANADTKAGDASGYALDGMPNSGADSTEVIVGTDRNDLIYARVGDDTVYGEGGNDILYGGNGIDRLYGGDGADTIYGDDGGDLIDGGNGDDLLYGGQNATAAAGLDQLIGSAGNDYIDGGIGIDKLSGSEGDDVIFGGQDTDAFTHGGEGNDYIDGGIVGDLLWGDNGDDVIVGGADQDIVAGMQGDDILRPGPLSQSLTGGGDEVVGGDGVDDSGNDGKGKGFDLLDLSDWQAAPKGATFNLVDQGNPLPAIDGAPQFPAVAQIEGVVGSRNDDSFAGDDTNNWLIGGSGNDSLAGGLGNDLIIGDGIRLDTLIGTYDSNYDLYFDGASHRAFGYTDVAETTGLDRNFIQSNGLLDKMGWGNEKHFTELLKTAMFRNYELGGSTVTDLWRNGVQQTTGEMHGTMGDGGTAGTQDTAVFTGNYADYKIDTVYFDLTTRSLVPTANANTVRVLKVTDKVGGRDGTDLVIGVEQLKFADGTISIGAPKLDLHAFTSGSYVDQFGSSPSAYNNSNGSALWTTSWGESGDREGSGVNPVTTGEIRVNSGALEFRSDSIIPGNTKGATITRGVDLSMVGTGTATLSFDFTESRLDLRDHETVQVQFAADGVNFETLNVINGRSNSGHVDLALTGPFTATAAIRFVFTGVNDANRDPRINEQNGPETVRIDNVNVTYKSPVDDGSNNWTATFTEQADATYGSNGTPVGISGLSGISDASGLMSAKVVLTNAKAGDVLTAGNLPAGISATTTTVAGVITLTLTGGASAADYQQAIDGVRFSSTSQAPDTTDRHIEVTVSNGMAESNKAISTIHVVSTNDPLEANDDSVITNYASGVTFSVKVADLLANDFDRDGGTVSFDTITSQSGFALPPPGGPGVQNTGLGTINVTDTSANSANLGGNFVYRGLSSDATSDTATVTVAYDTQGTLSGTDGANIIIANGINSVIDGNGGRDILYGGGGNDTFDYNAVGDVVTVGTVTGANVGQLEVIMDWNVGDRIDLSGIDARAGFGNQAFTSLVQSSAAFTAANANGGLHYFYVTDSHGQEFTVIEGSTDTDAAAEFQLALLGHQTLASGNGGNVIL